LIGDGAGAGGISAGFCSGSTGFLFFSARRVFWPTVVALVFFFLARLPPRPKGADCVWRSATSAASGGGQVFVPSEGLLTFHLAQSATVSTLSQAEMDRLAQGVPGGAQQQQLRRRYPTVYYGPGYYRPYPYGYPYPY